MSFSLADTKNITCQHLPTKIEGNKTHTHTKISINFFLYHLFQHGSRNEHNMIVHKKFQSSSTLVHNQFLIAHLYQKLRFTFNEKKLEDRLINQRTNAKLTFPSHTSHLQNINPYHSVYKVVFLAARRIAHVQINKIQCKAVQRKYTFLCGIPMNKSDTVKDVE